MKYFNIFVLLLVTACNKLPVGEDELTDRADFGGHTIELPFNASATETKNIPLGSSANLIVGKGFNYEARAILKFQFTDSLVQGADSIKMIIIRNPAFRRDTIRFSVHLVTAEFNETEATWQRKTATDAWTVPGGDYQLDSLMLASAAGDSTVILMNYNQLVAIRDAQGIILIPRDSGFVYYKSREAGASAQIRVVKNGTATTIPVKNDLHILTGPMPFYTDNWIGAGMAYRNYVKFDLDPGLSGQRVLFAELNFRVDGYYAHRDSIEVGVRTLLKPFTGFDTKTTSLIAVKRIAASDTSVSIDILDHVQRINEYPDSNYGFFLVMSPDNYDISCLRLRSRSYQLKIGYIEPPSGR